MELIDREEQIKRVGYAFDMQDLCLPHEFIAFLEEAKAVDAVPVVRCKDCKHHAGGMALDNLWCGKLSMVVAEDFYCKCGERNTDDEQGND